ncbi:serine protease [Deinococcus hopiensis KR-140]|uniref:Serine protease n=1 Tax=Deinococcus hopiensis KR-140 TaxID=695939 RepID=A0A1W1UPE9_9DEIO|nr:serine protease [Deinococcus hopiensis KR-140]
MRKNVLGASLALGLSLLTACGGGSTPVPTPAKQTMWGVVSLPGGETGSAQALPSGQTSLQRTVGRQIWMERYGQAAPTADGGGFLIKFRPGSLAAQAAELRVGSLTLQRQDQGTFFGYHLYRAVRGSLQGQATPAVQSVLTALGARTDVVSVIPNTTLRAFATPNDRLHALQWDQSMMNMERAWDVTTGQDVTVAVVDTGVVQHPDLVGKLLPGYDFISDAANGGDGDGRDANANDEGGDSGYHGSHVAGIIAATANNAEGITGASWGAKIVPVRVLGVSGGGNLTDILEGVWWAAGGEVEGVPTNAHPAPVINLSLGGDKPCDDLSQQVFSELAQAGVTVVAAAGNSDEDAGGAWPANCNHVITVGAVGPDGKRAPYSNYGARVDVMAPGGNTKLKIRVGGKDYPGGVYSTVKDEDGNYVYAPYNGTSMAAPQVAGLAALLLSAQPGITPAQVLARLRGTAQGLSAADCGVQNGCGAGVVDAAAALGTAQPGPQPTPAPQPLPQPPAAPLKTLVFALHLREGNENDVDEDLSLYEEIGGDTLRSVYKFDSSLTPGLYEAVAWQDLDGDLEIDDSEPVGAYRDLVDLRGHDRGNVNINLQPFAATAAGGQNALRENLRKVLQTKASQAQDERRLRPEGKRAFYKGGQPLR